MPTIKLTETITADYDEHPHGRVLFEECPDDCGGSTMMSIPLVKVKRLVVEWEYAKIQACMRKRERDT